MKFTSLASVKCIILPQVHIEHPFCNVVHANITTIKFPHLAGVGGIGGGRSVVITEDDLLKITDPVVVICVFVGSSIIACVRACDYFGLIAPALTDAEINLTARLNLSAKSIQTAPAD